MPDYIQVSFCILGDVFDDNIYIQIVESVKKLDSSIVSIIHLRGTNAVEVSANWDESEFEKKIEGIRKIANVKDLRMYKKNKFAARTVSESITFTDNASCRILVLGIFHYIILMKYEKNG